MRLPTTYSYTWKNQLRGHLSPSQGMSPCLPPHPVPPALALAASTAAMDSRAGWETPMAEGPRSHLQFAQPVLALPVPRPTQFQTTAPCLPPATLGESEPGNSWILSSHCGPVVAPPRYKKFAVSHRIPLYTHCIFPHEKHFLSPLNG